MCVGPTGRAVRAQTSFIELRIRLPPHLAQFVMGLSGMQIDEIMRPSTRKPLAMVEGDLFIDHDDVVEEAFALMVENGVSTLPVLDPQGQVLGSVTYLDVLGSLPETTQPDLGDAP